MKVIEREDEAYRSAKADRIKAGAELALSFLGDYRVAIDAVEKAVRAEIEWDKLEPADQLLADELIDLVVATLRERVDDGQLSGESLVAARSLIKSVIDATNFYA